MTAKNPYTVKPGSKDAFLVGLGGVLVFMLFGGLLLWLSWNLGLAGLLVATGIAASHISYWTALFSALGFRTIYTLLTYKG